MKRVQLLVTVLALLVTLGGFGQTGLNQRVTEYKELMQGLGATVDITFDCRKRKHHALKIDLHVGGSGGLLIDSADKQNMMVTIAVSGWSDILVFNPSFKKIMVKVVIEGTVQYEQCFIPVDETSLKVCSEIKETRLSNHVDDLAGRQLPTR